MEDLSTLVLELKDLDRLIIKALIECNGDDFAMYVTRFNENKKSIKTELLKNPVLTFPDVEDSIARKILQSISTGKLLPGEKALKGRPLGEVFSDELTQEELDKLIFDEFYVWFGPYEYIEKLYSIGSLILAVGQLPKHLKSFVNEARECYAFQQYAAVYSLCRTILEICIKDLCIKYQIIPSDYGNVRQQSGRIPELYELIHKLCDKVPQLDNYRKGLQSVRWNGNYIVHGNKTVKAAEAEQILRDTLSIIHDIYEAVASDKIK